MKTIFTSYLNSINNSLLAKGGREAFSLEEAFIEYSSLRDSFYKTKLFRKEITDVDRDLLNDTVMRSQDYMFSQQNEEGYWMGELEANTTLTAEYIFFMHFMNMVNVDVQRKMVNHLIRMQQIDGGWPIYHGGPSELSTTIEAYLAMKMAGVSQEELFMQKAKDLILKKGGVTAARVFTKIFLAIFDLYDWRGVPAMPVEIILVPNSAYINIYEMSCWSRTVVVPLLILFSKKPVCRISGLSIDELFVENKEDIDFSLEMKKFELSWKNIFHATDYLIKLVEKSPVKPFRKLAMKKAEKWILDHQDYAGDWCGIIPAMMNSVMALRVLGYSKEHPAVKKGIEAMERFFVEENDEIRLQSCISPVWDTAIATNALKVSGLPADHPKLVKSIKWIMSKQIMRKGDWQIKNTEGEPGGWAFEFHNDFYPDTDDTAEVLIAINRIKIPDEADFVEGKGTRQDVLDRGLKWLLSMQSKNGGWGAFDVDNDKEILNRIPFADHEALIDPPTSDVTGRILWLLGNLGYDKNFLPLKRAYKFVRNTQEEDGSWFGRWGVNYIYGTFLALNGLNSIGENMDRAYIRKAVNWMKAHQNHNGGWGETCKSYEDESLKGVGISTASQTAWALLGLIAAGEVNSISVKRGVNYLIANQSKDGSWEEDEFTGTGFPKHFYIKYHMYRNYFPLLALGEYKRNTIN